MKIKDRKTELRNTLWSARMGILIAYGIARGLSEILSGI
jgi:hypothetical protein